MRKTFIESGEFTEWVKSYFIDEDLASVQSELLADPDINVVHITSPNHLHFPHAKAALLAGKHVVCEKPIGVNARQAGEMWRAVREAGLGHFVPFWTRYVPACIRAREIVRQGVLGEIRSVVYRRSLPLATGNLPLVLSELGAQAGVVGATRMISDSVFSHDAP